MSENLNLTFVYLKDLNKPTPLLAYYNEPNKDVFNDEYKYSYSNDYINTQKYKHIWNMNAYLIYDEENKKVVNYKINEPEYLLWLLRAINLDLEITFKENFVRENQNFFKDAIDELSCKSN